jgi:hypothetical protein
VAVWRLLRLLIAALAGAGLWWFAGARTRAADPPSVSARIDPARVDANRVDPVRAARDVFQDSDFWWKQREPKQISGSWSSSWLESIVKAVWNLVRRLMDFLADLIAAILGSLVGVFTGSASGGLIVIWLIVAALLAWAIWKLAPVIVGWLTGRAAAPKPQAGAAWQTLAEASALFQQAGQAFHDGQYAEAIRLALLALIARLEQQGLLRYDPTRTNREYQKELRHSSELAASFGQLARIYERVWYGRLAAGREEAEQAVSLCGSVINREGLSPE